MQPDSLGDKRRQEALIARVRKLPEPPVAIEAMWDGDTDGWFVDLCAVVRIDGAYSERCLQRCRGGSDARLFNGQVPPWPETIEAGEAGRWLAAELGVPFHFPSPDRPEDDCPHWWQIAESYPCGSCGLPLLQRSDCPWRGTCYECHLKLERQTREARWTPEERAAPRCHLCGNPSVGDDAMPPRCASCRANYRDECCTTCGISMLRKVNAFEDASTCSGCVAKRRVAMLTEDQRRDLRCAAGRGRIPGLIAVSALLGGTLSDADEVLRVLCQRVERE